MRREMYLGLLTFVSGLCLASCASAPTKISEDRSAAQILNEYVERHAQADSSREPASISMAQNHYALLSSDEQFNKLLDAQATDHYLPILFVKNDEGKMDCNCWRYAMFFRNDRTKQVRSSIVIIEKTEELTKVKSIGSVVTLPDEEIGVKTKDYLAQMTEFTTSD